MGLNNGDTCGTTDPTTPFTAVDNTDIPGGDDRARAMVLANATLPSDQRTFYQFFNIAANRRSMQFAGRFSF